MFNVGLTYLETRRRGPDTGPLGIEYCGFVEIARPNEAVHVSEPVFRSPLLALDYLVSTYAVYRD